MEPVGIPLPTLRRLPLYLRLLERRSEENEDWISSEAMARELGFGAIQVRKDLGAVGAVGSPKRGFPVQDTASLLASFLGADDCSETFLIGSGPLARAVLADEGIEKRGFRIVAVFEPDPAARHPGDRHFQPLERLPELAKRMGTRLAILAVEPRWLAEATAVLARSDIAGVLDLSGTGTPFPPGMIVVRESFGAGLSSLAGVVRTRKPAVAARDPAPAGRGASAGEGKAAPARDRRSARAGQEKDASGTAARKAGGTPARRAKPAPDAKASKRKGD